ncbi:MAG: hypothetical protein QOJ19_2522 [Acidimicrobiia bacterium]|nr:hypothetical protein [Acidimicrobiia bacterium]
MPTYDFRCKTCGHRFEISRSFTEDGTPACVACGEEEAVVKVFPKVGISFKGSGFYKTDSRGSSSKGSSSSDSGSKSSDGGSKSSESSSSSSDSSSSSSSSSTSSTPSSGSSGSSSSSSAKAS